MFFKLSKVVHSSMFLLLAVVLQVNRLEAATATSSRQTVLAIENVTCQYCLSKVNDILISLDHTTRLRIINHPNIFSIIHHASLQDDTVVSRLTTAGFPAKVLGSANVAATEFQTELPNTDVKKQVVQKPCSASSQAWRNLIRRVHNGFITK